MFLSSLWMNNIQTLPCNSSDLNINFVISTKIQFYKFLFHAPRTINVGEFMEVSLFSMSLSHAKIYKI